MKLKSLIAGIIVLVILSIIAIKPLFIVGFFPMHDDTQPTRIYEMGQSLRSGMFPVRWSRDLGYGYGYPIFNFYAPLVYYIGGFINIFGIELLLTTKIVMAFGIVIAGISMYICTREIWGELGGLISGLLYLYAPYNALNLYVRGDLAEIYAYAILPLVIYAFYKIYSFVSKSEVITVRLRSNPITAKKESNTPLKRSNLWIYIALGSLCYALVILSHNLTALMLTPYLVGVIVIYAIKEYFTGKKYTGVKYFIFCLILGIIISAFYWLPALTEMKYTNVLSQIGGRADHNLHFVCLNQLWDSPWGFGGSIEGCTDGMSYRIGKIHIILALISVLLVPFFWKKNKFIISLVIIGILITIVTALITTQHSGFLWNSLSIMKFFQYPWRFLIIIVFSLSFIGGSVMWFLKQYLSINNSYKYMTFFIWFFIVATVILFYGKLFTPQTIYNKNAFDYISGEAVKWKISRISDEYLPSHFKKPENINDVANSKITFLNGYGEILSQELSAGRQNFEVNVNNRNALVLLRTAYFPSWNIYLNGKKANFEISDNGLILLVPGGLNHINLRFEETIIEETSNIISLSGIAVLIVAIIKSTHPEFNKGKTKIKP